MIAIYTFFSFLSGPKGIGAYNYLLAERERQWDNITNLGILYDELEKTRNNLLYDQDTLLIHARQLGYGQQDERFIRIVGLGYAKTVPVAAGSVYTAQNPEYVSDFNIKMVALCAGLLIFAFLFMLELIENRSR
ncbi:MAG: septum formation initiator family protein [Treponema sp.]|nr:septum formation initiator family protein [Treponema sp.]